MEEFLSSYVEDIEPSMNYDSKQTYINSFNDLTSLIITIGGALSIIIGLIGITNFALPEILIIKRTSTLFNLRLHCFT